MKPASRRQIDLLEDLIAKHMLGMRKAHATITVDIVNAATGINKALDEFTVSEASHAIGRLLQGKGVDKRYVVEQFKRRIKAS
jgi:hypothetical protein